MKGRGSAASEGSIQKRGAIQTAELRCTEFQMQARVWNMKGMRMRKLMSLSITFCWQERLARRISSKMRFKRAILIRDTSCRNRMEKRWNGKAASASKSSPRRAYRLHIILEWKISSPSASQQVVWKLSKMSSKQKKRDRLSMVWSKSPGSMESSNPMKSVIRMKWKIEISRSKMSHIRRQRPSFESLGQREPIPRKEREVAAAPQPVPHFLEFITESLEWRFKAAAPAPAGQWQEEAQGNRDSWRTRELMDGAAWRQKRLALWVGLGALPPRRRNCSWGLLSLLSLLLSRELASEALLALSASSEPSVVVLQTALTSLVGNWYLAAERDVRCSITDWRLTQSILTNFIHMASPSNPRPSSNPSPPPSFATSTSVATSCTTLNTNNSINTPSIVHSNPTALESTLAATGTTNSATPISVKFKLVTRSPTRASSRSNLSTPPRIASASVTPPSRPRATPLQNKPKAIMRGVLWIENNLDGPTATQAAVMPRLPIIMVSRESMHSSTSRARPEPSKEPSRRIAKQRLTWVALCENSVLSFKARVGWRASRGTSIITELSSAMRVRLVPSSEVQVAPCPCQAQYSLFSGKRRSRKLRRKTEQASVKKAAEQPCEWQMSAQIRSPVIRPSVLPQKRRDCAFSLAQGQSSEMSERRPVCAQAEPNPQKARAMAVEPANVLESVIQLRKPQSVRAEATMNIPKWVVRRRPKQGNRHAGRHGGVKSQATAWLASTRPVTVGERRRCLNSSGRMGASTAWWSTMTKPATLTSNSSLHFIYNQRAKAQRTMGASTSELEPQEFNISLTGSVQVECLPLLHWNVGDVLRLYQRFYSLCGKALHRNISADSFKEIIPLQPRIAMSVFRAISSSSGSVNFFELASIVTLTCYASCQFKLETLLTLFDIDQSETYKNEASRFLVITILRGLLRLLGRPNYSKAEEMAAHARFFRQMTQSKFKLLSYEMIQKWALANPSIKEFLLQYGRRSRLVLQSPRATKRPNR